MAVFGCRLLFKFSFYIVTLLIHFHFQFNRAKTDRSELERWCYNNKYSIINSFYWITIDREEKKKITS